jgi:hypothetical protein
MGIVHQINYLILPYVFGNTKIINYWNDYMDNVAYA